MTLRVGSVVFATWQGLGVLAKSFYDNGVVTDVVVVKHAHHPTHNEEWYPGADVIGGREWRRDRADLERLVARVDALLLFETPFHYELLTHCRAKGVKTAWMPMYECAPRILPERPDLILCPSLLDQQYYPDGLFLPVPVDVPWRQRTEARVFCHNAGNGGLRGRNGTGELLDAMAHVRSPIKLILRSQKPLPWDVARDPRIDYRVGTVPYEELWEEGDVLIHPHKFDGLSLPLQEARAAGMLVMAVDRFPDNTYLARESLIPVAGYSRACISPRCHEFDEARIDPRAIAATIDAWFGRDIADYSRAGREWAATMSWDVLRPRYLEALKS